MGIWALCFKARVIPHINIVLLMPPPPPPSAAASSSASGAPPPPPSVRDFYDGLYHSPLFAAHHKICCNVGFGGDSEAPDERTTKFHAAHAADARQLELYRALVGLLSDRELQDAAPRQVLELGCGAGGGLCELQSLFPTARITGADISSQALARARETWARFAVQAPSAATNGNSSKRELRLLHQSCEKLAGVASLSVDVACAVQTLQEVQDLPRAVAEIGRVLRPGGYLFVADFIPQDEATDRVHRELLAPAASGVGVFEVVHETLASYNAALGCQESSPTLRELIAEHFPPEFQAEMKTFFLVENSSLYELLRRDQMGYRLVCLRKTGALEGSESLTGFEKAEEEVEEWSDGEADDSSEYESDASINDDDLPNYYSYKELYPQLEVLKDNYDVILEEMQVVHQTSAWPFWPEKHYTEGDNEWRVFPFCYTFPAHDASKTTWVPATCEMCPRTVAILKGIPGIRTALFSKLGPGTTLTAHRGWADLSNHILRCHLGLTVPTFANGKPCCSMVVGGEHGPHGERELLVFDDSKLHFAFNKHPEQTRVILIVDLYRPDHLPRGRAKGGHSDELDEFIDTFGKQALADSDARE